MSTVAAAAVDRAMDQLREGARMQRDAITELKRLGVLRSRGLVCDLGEALAASLYGVELEPPSTPGFDLVDGDGARVQVRTLRCTPENWRTKVGRMKEPYDKLLAIRLDEHYEPIAAVEVPREVLDEAYPQREVSWTQALDVDKRVGHVPRDELRRAGRSPASVLPASPAHRVERGSTSS
jgi:hypothetical protein